MIIRRILLHLVATAALLSPHVSAQHYAEINGWYFDNFNTDPLTWDLYRDTFLGVPPTRDPVSSAFDVLFFDHLYEHELGSSGNCYGMSLQSLLMLKKGANLGYCLPIYQYSGDLVGTLPGGDTAGPTDSVLTRVINQMHGHQVNTETLRLFLDLINAGKTRDGKFAYDQVQFYKLSDDPTLVSITKSLNPADGGHTMVAYDARMVGGDRKIFVYDPNSPWPISESYYTSDQNVINVDSSGNWNFVMGGGTGDTWSGGPSSGGHITITPLSVTGPRGRLPTSMGLDSISEITSLFVFANGGELTQVTNADGKRLFKPGTQKVDINPATGLRNILPWYRSDTSKNTKVPFLTYFIVGDPGGALTLDISHKGNEYGLRVIGSRGSLELTARGSSKPDKTTIANIGHSAPSVVLSGNAQRIYEVLFTHASLPGERVRQFHLKDLTFAGKGNVRLAVTDNYDGLVTSSSEAPLSFELDLKKWTPYSQESLVSHKVDIKSAESLLIKPDNWTDLTWAAVEERKRSLMEEQ